MIETAWFSETVASEFLTIFESGRELVEEGGGWSTCVVTYSFNLLNNPTTVLLNWLKLEYFKDRLAIFQLNSCLHNIPILSHSVCFTIKPQHLYPHFPKIDLLNGSWTWMAIAKPSKFFSPWVCFYLVHKSAKARPLPTHPPPLKRLCGPKPAFTFLIVLAQ